LLNHFYSYDSNWVTEQNWGQLVIEILRESQLYSHNHLQGDSQISTFWIQN